MTRYILDGVQHLISKMEARAIRLGFYRAWHKEMVKNEIAPLEERIERFWEHLSDFDREVSRLKEELRLEKLMHKTCLKHLANIVALKVPRYTEAHGHFPEPTDEQIATFKAKNDKIRAKGKRSIVVLDGPDPAVIHEMQATTEKCVKLVEEVTGIADASLPPMPETKDRQLFNPDQLETDLDWAGSNEEAVGWLADNHAAIRCALSKLTP